MTAGATESPRVRLGQLVAARRKSLGQSINQAAVASGISRTTWTAVEAGTRDTEAYTYGRMERVLRWAAGSIDEILAGGQATVAQESTQEPDAVEVADPDLRRYATIYSDPNLDPDLRNLMRQQMRLWVDQIEVQKRLLAEGTGRRKTA
jgi:transcriptional regulator with XRE-family HTH domain